MAKQLVAVAKFQIPGGKATPAPPVGTALGKHGVNLGQFVQQFNDQTREANGMMIPVVVSVYNDRSFEFLMKSPPAAVLLMKAAGLDKGSGTPNKKKVGKVTEAQLADIAKTKMNDLNARDVDHAVRMIAGTARSMGLRWSKAEKKSAVSAAGRVATKRGTGSAPEPARFGPHFPIKTR